MGEFFSDSGSYLSIGVAVAGFVLARLLQSLVARRQSDRAVESRVSALDAWRRLDGVARAELSNWPATDTGDLDLVAIFEEGLKTDGRPDTELVPPAIGIGPAEEALRKRIEAIEQRLPDASTVDKVASVNDAILATKVEYLEGALARLEGQQLNRWDVALVVFAVLAAVGGVIGLIGGTIKLFV